jgi:hypothetical protein
MFQEMPKPINGGDAVPATAFVTSGNFTGGTGNSLTLTGLEANKKYLVIIGSAGSSIEYAEQFATSVTMGSGGSLQDIQMITGQLGSGMYTATRSCFITTTASSITLNSSETGSGRKMPVSIFTAN